jgi:glycosyltransferase involved in cell wall biosynthesis
MRILSITAGAAGMYCGSCFRDNALAAELIRRGHDVSLVPIYTPTRTDEPNVSRGRVLFGGISVYLQQYSTLFRRTPWILDRLWDSPRVIAAFSRRAVQTDASLLGDLTVSMLEGEHGAIRKEFAKLVDWLRDEPLPDVVNIPNSLLISLAAPLRRVLGRPVLCTLQGEELFINGLTARYRDRALALIRTQVADVDRFIAVSDYCARFMGGLLQIPRERISVAPLGIDMDGYAPPAPDTARFTVGYFARVAPEKGLHVLADAYVRFRARTPGASVRLHVAGYRPSGPSPYLDGVRERLAAAGLADEFSDAGELDRQQKIAFLRGLDVLSVPATYDEPKGLFLIEAMACGVPVVQPRRGAFIEVVENTGGGLLVDPGDPEALANGFYTLWADRGRLRALGAQAAAGVRAHYTVARSAERLLEAYRAAIAGGVPEPVAAGDGRV